MAPSDTNPSSEKSERPGAGRAGKRSDAEASPQTSAYPRSGLTGRRPMGPLGEMGDKVPAAAPGARPGGSENGKRVRMTLREASSRSPGRGLPRPRRTLTDRPSSRIRKDVSPGGPSTVLAEAREAMALFEQNKASEAVSKALAIKVGEDAPDAAALVLSLEGYSFLVKGDPAKALGCLEEGVGLLPDCQDLHRTEKSDVHYRLADICEQLRNVPKGLEAISAGISLLSETEDAPRLRRAMAARGRLYYLMRQYEKSRQAFEKSLSYDGNDPESWKLYHGIAKCCDKLGLKDEAKAAYESSRRCVMEKARANFGRMLGEAGQTKTAASSAAEGESKPAKSAVESSTSQARPGQTRPGQAKPAPGEDRSSSGSGVKMPSLTSIPKPDLTGVAEAESAKAPDSAGESVSGESFPRDPISEGDSSTPPDVKGPTSSTRLRTLRSDGAHERPKIGSGTREKPELGDGEGATGSEITSLGSEAYKVDRFVSVVKPASGRQAALLDSGRGPGVLHDSARTGGVHDSTRRAGPGHVGADTTDIPPPVPTGGADTIKLPGGAGDVYAKPQEPWENPLVLGALVIFLVLGLGIGYVVGTPSGAGSAAGSAEVRFTEGRWMLRIARVELENQQPARAASWAARAHKTLLGSGWSAVEVARCEGQTLEITSQAFKRLDAAPKFDRKAFLKDATGYVASATGLVWREGNLVAESESGD